MLKKVMLGAGGVMLAAAIFASSVGPAVQPSVPEGTIPPIAAAPQQNSDSVASPPPVPDFAGDSGDTQFGAPMIESTPADLVDPAPLPADAEAMNEDGDHQFYARPGDPSSIPE